MSLTLSALIDAYRTDPVSPYHKLRYRTRENSDSLLRRLHKDHGSATIAGIKGRNVMAWYDGWTSKGTEKIPMAHALIAQLRTLIGFGLALLDDAECARVSAILRHMKIPNGKPRTAYLTAAQADLIRHYARTVQLASLALEQALQFEAALRQKDLIGEFVPQHAEPGESDIVWRGKKWLRGMRWPEIDDNLILRHVTSKKGKLAVHDLKFAPMVIDELSRAYPGLVVSYPVFDADGELVREMVVDRSVLPASGPVIVSEETGRPWLTPKFRATWRKIARAVGIPDNVQNRDSRAGAATEADNHGASRDDTKELLGHSNAATTEIYIREKARRAAKAQRVRVAQRLKPA